MNILCYNYISTVITPNYLDYISNILNNSEYVYRNCKISSTSVYFVEILKIFKWTIIHNIIYNINKSQYSVFIFNFYYVLKVIIHTPY